MGKNTRGHKEFDQLQRFKSENRKLKRELSSLKKQLSRMDSEKYKDLREDIKEQEEEQKLEKRLKSQWQCWECGKDHLRLRTFERRDGTFYYRVCNNCGHRTKMQKYHDKVIGID